MIDVETAPAAAAYMLPVEATGAELEPFPRGATVTIVPQDLNTDTPAIPAHLILIYICRVLCDYAVFEQIEDVVTIALWIASTWFAEPTSEQGMTNGTMMFEAHPRLLIVGEPESGKNRVMKIMRRLVRNPSGIGTAKVTAVGVRNLLSHGKTVFIDDLHDRLGLTGRRNSDLKDELLAYSRDSVSIDGAEGKDNERDLFGPIVMAAQPQILQGMQGDALKDLFQRCFIINMRAADGVVPKLDGEFEETCANLRKALEMWGTALYHEMRSQRLDKYTAIHTMPEYMKGRRLECADVICAVADRAVNPWKVVNEGVDTEWARVARRTAALKLYNRGPVEEITGKLAEEFGEIDEKQSVFDALSPVRKATGDTESFPVPRGRHHRR